MTFYGHIVDIDGLHTCKNKVEAIEKAPASKNVTELCFYLGLLNFYGKFLRNLSSILAPLHQLLKKDAKWVLKVNQQRAFNKTKGMLQIATVLIHYDDKKRSRFYMMPRHMALELFCHIGLFRWFRKANKISVLIIIPSREELFAIRQRRSSCGICSE